MVKSTRRQASATALRLRRDAQHALIGFDLRLEGGVLPDWYAALARFQIVEERCLSAMHAIAGAWRGLPAIGPFLYRATEPYPVRDACEVSAEVLAIAERCLDVLYAPTFKVGAQGLLANAQRAYDALATALAHAQGAQGAIEAVDWPDRGDFDFPPLLFGPPADATRDRLRASRRCV